MNSNCSNSLYMRNLQEQVRKAFCYQILFWHFTVWINHCSDFKHFANSQPSALNLKSFSSSLEHLFLTIGLNNFGNKIPILGIQVHNFRWENSFHIPHEIPISFKTQVHAQVKIFIIYVSSREILPNNQQMIEWCIGSFWFLLRK